MTIWQVAEDVELMVVVVMLEPAVDSAAAAVDGKVFVAETIEYY